ncbi:nucleotide pyrophosphohydrolase [Thermodesulfobacteriota bacterium]
MDIKEIQDKLRQFAKDRDWDQYHTPKNLASALVVEAGELLEIFQWMTEEESNSLRESKTSHQELKEEIADVLLYLLRLADKLDIDVEEAIEMKLNLNAQKYPVDLAKGNATKYNRREE